MLNDRERKGKRARTVSDAHLNDIRMQRAREHARKDSPNLPEIKPAENSAMPAVLVTPETLIHPLVLQDGVTHINIDAHARTELGRLLLHKLASRFEHPMFGQFKSVEGFWGFIRDGARDDRWRYVSGMAAKYETRKLGPRYIANIHQIIMEANFYKVEQNETIRSLMVASTLPFDHYYIFRSPEMAEDNPGVPIRPQIAPWLTRGFEEIRTLLQFGKRPDRPDYTDVYFRNESTSGTQSHS